MLIASHLAALWRRVDRNTRLGLWFPRIPLALAVGVAGTLALLPTLSRHLHEYLHLPYVLFSNSLHPLGNGVPELILQGVPSAVIGALQILIAIGLILRSRLAWITALLMAVTQLVLAIFYNHQHPSAWAVVYVAILLLALAVSGRAFPRSSLAASRLFALGATMLLLSYGVLGSLVLGQDFSPAITNLQQAVYFTVVTMSTVGYGDIIPRTDNAKLFVVSVIVVGITVFLTSLTTLVGPILQSRLAHILQLGGARKMQRVNHFIIVGTSALARNTAHELVGRNRGVVVITDDTAARIEGAEMEIGDSSDLDVLRKAGAERAHSVLALSEDDAENAFVILALRELTTKAKTVAAVNVRKNLERIRRLQPDMIMAPNIFGSEVLAMALADEKIDGDQLMKRYLDVRAGQG